MGDIERRCRKRFDCLSILQSVDFDGVQEGVVDSDMLDVAEGRLLSGCMYLLL